MSTQNNTRFNAEAASWDSNPDVQLATQLAHAAYLDRLPHPSASDDLSNYDVLEIGCGTGLLSLALAPSVRSLTAVDAAQGMIAVLDDKITSGGIRNVRAVCALLTDPDDERLQTDPVTKTAYAPDKRPKRFDLVVSHLVLHHISDLRYLFSTLAHCLKPGGRVMVTDFEDFGPEARRFHPEDKMDGVERHGIQRDEIRGILEGAGFVDVKVETAFEMDKLVETTPGSGVKGPTMRFPFLVCEGTRA